MPEATPGQAGRRPRPGARFLAEVVAANVRDRREALGLRQEDVAARMVALGHGRWVRVTASNVERGHRNLTVDELLALAIVLDATPAELLDPAGARGADDRGLDLGPVVIPNAQAREWLAGHLRVFLMHDGTYRLAPVGVPGAGGVILPPADEEAGP